MKNTRKKTAICIFLMMATFFIYSQVGDNEFTSLDDSIHCCLGVYAAGLTSGSAKWAFTTFATGNWFPLTWFSHILDFQLYGFHPKGHHLTSLFFHIANAIILFIVLSRMTGKLWQSGFVAAMFAFHPINVESVAWAAERKNVLSTLFWLITMWAYVHYTKKPTVKNYSLVFLFFSLGLLSKSMVVTLPFILLLMDYWPLRRFKFAQEKVHREILEKNTNNKSEALRLVLEKTPLFLLATGLSIVTFIAQKSFGNMNYVENLEFSKRLTNAMVSYLEYLGKMLWPSGLSIFYPHPGNTLPIWQGVLCGMVLVGITIIAIRLIRKAPYFAFGWFWYLGTLVPVIGIVQVGGQSMADRYAYVTLIGIFIIIAWGVPELISKWRYKKKVLLVSAGIIIFALLIRTWEQVSHWKNSITVFNHAIRVTDKTHPSFALVHNHLGMAFYAEQRNEEAIYHYKRAIKISPNHTYAHYNLGLVLARKGELKEAINHFKETLRLRPNLTVARDYLEFTKLRLQELE